MLLDQLEAAWYVPESDHTNNPAATWISRIARHYVRKQKFRRIILNKLKARDFDQHNFVARYLMQENALPFVFEGERQIKECVSAIADCVRAGNEYVKDCLKDYMWTISPPEWDKEFVESLKDLTDPDNPEIYFDSTPFLGRFMAQPNPVQPVQEEDEIPF